MFKDIINLLIIYFYLFFVGIGLWSFLTPKFFRQKCLFPILPALFGLIFLLITNIYLIGTNNNVTKSPYICLIFGIITLISAIKFRKEVLFEELKKLRKINFNLIYHLIILLFISIIVLSPTLKAGYSTTPYRAGTDQIGYAETAKFFQKGGTVNKAKNDITNALNAINIKSPDSLINKKYNLLNFNTVLHYAFTIQWPRWGFASVVASFESLLNITHPYQLEFSLLIIPYLYLFAFCYFALHHIFKKSKTASLLVSSAVIFNCNIINLYYEGHYAQIMALPMLFLLFLTYLWQRQENNLNNHTPKSKIQLFFFISFLISGIISVYTESLSLFVAFLVLSSLFDIILIKKISIYKIFYNFAALTTGIIITLPYTIKWIPVLKNTKFVLDQIRVSGIWQPKWAFISEIVGLSCIYVPEYYRKGIIYLVERTPTDLILNLIISLMIIGCICFIILRHKEFDKSFWLAIPAFIVLVFYKTFYIEETHNYQYMKTYTIFAPFLVILLFLSIDFIFSKFQNLKIPLNIVKYSMFLIIIMNGLMYIETYNRTGNYVTKNMYNLENLNKSAHFDTYALIVEKNIKTQMLIPFFDFNWIQGENKDYLKPYADKKICLIKNSKKLDCTECYIKENLKNIIYMDSDFIFVNTGKTIKETYFKNSI